MTRGILRRLLEDPDVHVSLDCQSGDLVIDGAIMLTPDEVEFVVSIIGVRPAGARG